MQLFEEYGFHGVSVNEIISKSGTSKGGFYHHFHSKDELLYVIHDYFISYVLSKAQEVNATAVKPTEKLQTIIQSFVKVFDLYKPHISVFYQENMYLKPQYAEAIRVKRNSYKKVIFQVLEEGIAAKEFRPELSVEITGMTILGMVNWTYKWYKTDGEKSIEQIADMYVDFVLQSILTQQAKETEEYQRFFLKHVFDAQIK